MLFHRRSFPRNLLGRFPNNLPVLIYTPGWREALRVNCLAQEHNTVSPARARTQTARSWNERTNHEATTPREHTYPPFYILPGFVQSTPKIANKNIQQRTGLLTVIPSINYAGNKKILT